MDNGNHVTRAELKAHLDPMREDIHEIKDNMRVVLEYVNQQKGADSKGVFLSDRRLAYAAIVGALLAPLAWAIPSGVFG